MDLIKRLNDLVSRNLLLALIFVYLIAGIPFSSQAAKENQPPHDIFLPLLHEAENLLYSSINLAGHSLFAECNPGGGTQCPCTDEDASLVQNVDYGEVISNVREANTYVNAIGFKKFTEIFPDNSPITLDVYNYSGEFRLPILPTQDIHQMDNPQAIHMMIQLWDGRSALLPIEKTTLEGAIYWSLNPWEADYGKIKVYVYPLTLVDSGITLTPDRNWHSFSLVIDLIEQRYVNLTIDGQTVDLSSYDLAQVYHPEWGTDLSISITSESMAAWPQQDCRYIFKWTTQFRNLSFSQSY